MWSQFAMHHIVEHKYWVMPHHDLGLVSPLHFLESNFPHIEVVRIFMRVHTTLRSSRVIGPWVDKLNDKWILIPPHIGIKYSHCHFWHHFQGGIQEYWVSYFRSNKNDIGSISDQGEVVNYFLSVTYILDILHFGNDRCTRTP